LSATRVGAGRAAAFLPAVLALAAVDGGARAWLLPAGALLLAVAWRGTRRAARVLAATALFVQTLALIETRLDARSALPDAQLLEQRLATVRARFGAVLSELTTAARDAAASAQVAPALAGRSSARAQVFAELERVRAGRALELALQTRALEPVAWAGRPADIGGYRDLLGLRDEAVVLEGALGTTLLAVTPVRDADGRAVAVITAERVLASRPDLRNRFVSDFDRLAEGLPEVEVQYYDVRDDPRSAHAFDPLPPGRLAREDTVRAADGRLLARVRAAALPGAPRPGHASAVRRLVSLLLALALVVWGYVGRAALGAHALAATAALRALFVLLGPPWPAPTAELLSPNGYASPLLGPLLGSPLEALLTLGALAHAAAALLVRLSRLPVPSPSLARLLVCGLAAPALLAAPFAWIADTTANASLDLETLTLVPKTASHLALQASLLLVLALGGAWLTLLMSWGGPPPATRTARLALGAGWLAVAAVADTLWPRRQLGLPLVPALALFALAAALGLTRGRWQAWLARASPARRAGVVPVAAACGALLLYPSLAHFGEKEARHQIENDEAPLILRQPQWRDYVLEQTCRRIDLLRLIDGAYPTQHPLGVEQLAFAVWSATDLAAFGFSSAVEVQDAHGGLVSRFALNLPSLDAPAAALPESESWVVDRERLRVGSAERVVLHARRRLTQDGVLRGGVHVYLADDFWNLPFLPARDAYGALYRPEPRPGVGGRDVTLMVYDREHAVQFASAERPPALTPELLERLRASPRGLWTTLPIDGRPYHTFLFSDAQATYALAYAQRRAELFVADLVEAAAAFGLLALGVLLALMLVRTLLGRRTLSLPALVAGVRRRFRARLFAAFVAVAIAPVAVMQGVVPGVVRERLRREAEDQALERASVAQKAVEDFAVYQRNRRDSAAPDVTDAALVWIASLIRNDLDVFADGRLLASSKRELYASGLLSARVSGPVYRELVLEGRPRALSSERVGDFAYRVVSVPVRLGAGQTGILRVPLALRERELQSVLADVDRLVRLASVLFLLLAAGLAQSMARRIAGPLRDLTAATRRVAQGDLTARVGTESRDELRELVEAFNQMAADLERQRHDLERSNRLAAWAEMARQVAHEVKNPLTPIQLSAEHLRRVWRDPQADFGAALALCTDTILRQVRTLRDIVTEFSAFARPPAGSPAELDLVALLRDVVQPYAALPPGVTLRLEIAEGLRAPVRGERRLLERALVNLIENALQAVEGHGSLVLRLHADEDAGRLVVEVEDSGPGIDLELGERVFEPFFSTKIGGSGLGLALVRKIAEEHGGGVTLDSRPGRTSARLWLPRAPQAASAAPGSAAPDAQAP
jgi:signal transduction histidine kinase